MQNVVDLLIKHTKSPVCDWTLSMHSQCLLLGPYVATYSMVQRSISGFEVTDYNDHVQ
jgi:hypothetical protein